MNRMISNAIRALEQVLEVRARETVLLITDHETQDIAASWARACERMNATPVQFLLPEKQRPLKSVPSELLALMPKADIAITAFSSCDAETAFRYELLTTLTRHARRVAHSPGITNYIMSRGPMVADFQMMAGKARELINRLDDAVSLHVTAPGGTDIRLDVSRRPFLTDTAIPDGGTGNLPCGEIWCSPVEESAAGIIVCDASIGDLGRVPSSVTLSVANGRVQKVECQDSSFRAKVDDVLSTDENASSIAEFGIGLNPAAGITGNVLEDEKAAGTAHIAFGNNAGIGGGTIESRSHQDFVFLDPTVTVTFADGAEFPLMVSGRITRDRRHRTFDGNTGWNRVLAVIDLSTASEKAIAMADRLARLNHAELAVCHIINRPLPVNMLFPQYSAMNAGMNHLKREHDDAAQHIEAMVSDITRRRSDEYEIAVFIGDPVRSVLEFAVSRDIDLMVLPGGSDEYARRFTGLGLKSLAENATCDVLVVRQG